MDRSTIYTAIVKRFPWLGKGTLLYCLLYSRQWQAQRKLDRTRRKRFDAWKRDTMIKHGKV